MTAKRRNVVFMIADDHSFSALGVMGDPTVRTPALDALAKEGTVVRRAHTMGGLCGAVCVPARACLLTGVNTFSAVMSQTVDDYAGLLALRPELPLLPEVLRSADYHTYMIGKWHNDKASLNRGFCDGDAIFVGGMYDQFAMPLQPYDPGGEYPQESVRVRSKHATELLCDAAVDFLRDRRTEDPFFLYLAFTSPHDPRTAPEPFASMYAPDEIPLPRSFLPEHPFDNGELGIRDELLAAFPREPAEIRRHLADYYAMISHTDAEVGRVLQALRDTGQAEDTIVVYTSDHGLAVGQHGLMGKQNMYDHSVRVPMIVSGPGIPNGKVVEAPVMAYDLYPTLCEFCDVPVPNTVEGRSMVPLLTGETTGGRDSVFSVYKDLHRMVSTGEWKLIRYYQSASGKGESRLQLFDLKKDPWEMRDLSADPRHHSRIESLAATMAEWQRSVGDPLARIPVIP